MSNQSINIHGVTQVKTAVQIHSRPGLDGAHTFGVLHLDLISSSGVCEVSAYISDLELAERLRQAFDGYNSNHIDEDVSS